MSALPNQFKRAQKLSTKRGWTWTKRTNHVEVRDADNEFVISISTTMYDGPLTKKVLSKLRKANCPGA
jgi:hypothetical protein